jgi:hypothetical protein
VGVSQKTGGQREKRHGIELHPAGSAFGAKVGYDLRVASDPSLRGSDWAPSVQKRPGLRRTGPSGPERLRPQSLPPFHQT